MQITPVPDVTFAAEARDVVVTEIDGACFAQLEAALYEHGLLVFRDQYLDAGAQAGFARRFGEIEGASTMQSDRARSISNRRADGSALEDDDPIYLTLTYPTRFWHADGTFNSVAPKVCLLSAAALPSEGAQTDFADMCAAYDALDAATRARVADLTAYHSNLVGTTRVLPRDRELVLRSLVGEDPVDGWYGLNYRARVPRRRLVERHPVTGRFALGLGRHVFGAAGMQPEESDAFLRELEAFACRPPRIYEHRWRVGDLVVFDNRRLIHRAFPYTGRDRKRELLNSRIVGDSLADVALNEEGEPALGIEAQRAELARLRAGK
jgi:alpha-ketoglutarate-dependent 2,4-dichlorophenoxyacetate dioxygenase